ncbi:MAG: hypothetical protein IPP94_19865 [Ignavibacteria bacterium]|nr:hypothetical protein [Ignavibacteria bacterium]
MKTHTVTAAILFLFTVSAPSFSQTSCSNDPGLLDTPDDILNMVTRSDDTLIQTYAEYHPVLLKTALDNYAVCLRSDNHGVVESAIAQLVRLKLDVPNLSAPDCVREMRRLSTEGRTQMIRLKARFALMLCDDPALFDLAQLHRSDEPDAVFAEIASQLRSKLIVSEARE